MKTIAFIGLGNMGMPMAQNLQKAGFQVQGFDAVEATREQAAQNGLSIASSVAGAVAGADGIVLMLPNGKIVLNVLAEVLSAADKGALVIDCSTIDVASAKQFHDEANQFGLLSLDAPVSGGTAGAEAATLTFMAGGSKDAYAKGEAVLSNMGKKLVHCGDGGAGQSAKICNNMLLGISMIGACEAFALAEKLGLSAQSAFDVISTSSGFCWSVNNYCPVPGVGPTSPSDNAYQPGFAAELMLKDLNLSQQAAGEIGQSTPMGERALELYSDFVTQGGEGKDFSGIIEALKQAAR